MHAGMQAGFRAQIPIPIPCSGADPSYHPTITGHIRHRRYSALFCLIGVILLDLRQVAPHTPSFPCHSGCEFGRIFDNFIHDQSKHREYACT